MLELDAITLSLIGVELLIWKFSISAFQANNIEDKLFLQRHVYVIA